MESLASVYTVSRNKCRSWCITEIENELIRYWYGIAWVAMCNEGIKYFNMEFIPVSFNIHIYSLHITIFKKARFFSRNRICMVISSERGLFWSPRIYNTHFSFLRGKKFAVKYFPRKALWGNTRGSNLLIHVKPISSIEKYLLEEIFVGSILHLRL